MTAVPNRSGDVIGGRYRVVRAVGGGAFGAVYDAEAFDGRRVAIKVMHDGLEHEGERWRFEREGALLRDLDHPNLVRLLDLGFDGAEPFLVFELLEGRPLSDELQRVGFMSASRVAGIARQILGALGATHAQGIVHRDIKPSNVFLCHSRVDVDVVKVIDFGVATSPEAQLEKLTAPGMIVGSPGYMAPEQLRAREVTPASDLFSVGALMVELLCGYRVMGETLMDVCRTHLAEGPFPIPRAVILSELGEVVHRALAREPRDRYASAQAMIDAIDRCLPPPRSAPRSASGTLLLPEHLDSDVSPSSTIDLDQIPWRRDEDETA